MPRVSVMEVPGTCLFFSGERTHPDIHFLDSSPASFRVSHMYQNYKMLDPFKLVSLKLVSSECLFPKHSRAPAHSQEVSGSGPAPSCSVSLRYTGVLSLPLKSTAEASFARRCLLLTASHHSLSPGDRQGRKNLRIQPFAACLHSPPSDVHTSVPGLYRPEGRWRAKLAPVPVKECGWLLSSPVLLLWSRWPQSYSGFITFL